ncbi:unnamed protein product, partial [Laminaria digitata]
MERDGDAEGEGHPLLEAVQSCIAAAAGEFDVGRQQALMRAAGYGKSFLSDYDSDEFVECCRKLRVLNNCRHKAAGMPITSHQYDRLTPEVLVDRLAMRHLHLLAVRVCEHLRLRRDRVAVHWACRKIVKACSGGGATGTADAPTDEELTRAVVDKLRPCGQISYAEVARAAERAGRRRLATMLLDLEPLAEDQVPLLLSMGENDLGLKKAILSGEDDLVYLAVRHIEQEAGASEKGREAFCELMHAHPEALRLLKVYYREKGGYMERKKLHNLCTFGKQYLEAGTLAVRQAFTHQERLNGRLEGMKEAEGMFAHRKELAFQLACTKEQAELLEIQRDLDRKTGLEVFVDMSVSETLFHLIVVGATPPAGGVQGRDGVLLAEASALQKRLRVPDKRFWYIKIKALASVGDWEALRKFGAERKSPIGYKPFALACMRNSKSGLLNDDSERYIDSYIERV